MAGDSHQVEWEGKEKISSEIFFKSGAQQSHRRKLGEGREDMERKGHYCSQEDNKM